jgi:1-acyl-sn-glycerol-3-phosphate acyltransferase
VAERHSRFFRLVGLPLAKLVCSILFFFLGPYRVRGKYRVPSTGGVLILSNHQSDIDPVAVQISCPRPIYFMAKSELFEMRLLGKVIRWFKAFPVKRGEPDKGAIGTAVELLKAGEVVCVFPEGELSETGELLPLKPGFALIVRMAQVPVICLGIDGTRRIMPYGKVIPRPAWGWVTATWGEPHTFERKAPADDIVTWVSAQLTELTERPSAGN